MPFTSSVGTTFNCGFCCTFVYWYYYLQPSTTSAAGSSTLVSRTIPKVSLLDSFKEKFPGFTVGDDYFTNGQDSQLSQFERHCMLVKKAWAKTFLPRNVDKLQRANYIAVFSLDNWGALSKAEKSKHSLSNCEECARSNLKAQRSRPLQPCLTWGCGCFGWCAL